MRGVSNVTEVGGCGTDTVGFCALLSTRGVTENDGDGAQTPKKGVKKAKKKKSKAKITDSDLKKLIAEMTRVLGDHVSEVKINSSLIDSPVCISIGENVYDKTMQKILQQRQGMSISKPVLEVNPNHDVMIKLSDMFKNKQTKNINTTAHILLDYALIMDGEKPLNIEEFGKNMQDLIGKFN